MVDTQYFTTRTAKIWLGEDGIIRKVFLDRSEETLPDALESAEVIKNLSKDKKLPLMVDFSPVRSMDPEARAYYAKASPDVAAVGGITKSLMGRMIGNFFIGFNRNKSSTPGKIFNSEEDAVEWLKTFL